MNIKKYILATLEMALIAESLQPQERLRVKVKPTKKCLVCGRSHNHNNCFCSAECCRIYKHQKRYKV